ncbi:hypothetical protein SBRCBS47491_006639 [Sporothrix bragantina]|uniref:Gastric mucin-like protein n=1 Tax=Sporothrix bragantina TaxID=671064 RepID=A0ABP0C6L6_9PEZI
MAKVGPQYSGSLVALEGLPEAALETQLRLLPSSSQILVLPSLQQYLGKNDQHVLPFAPSFSSAPLSSSVSSSSVSSSSAPSQSDPATAPFDARRYIKGIHDAAAARRAIALDFLQNNSTGNIHQTLTKPPPRKIVFLNGGTATSHALCIEAIRDHDAAAGGSLEQAALLFDQLTAHGVAGLESDAKSSVQETSRLDIAVDDEDEDAEGGDDDPITKAMRAADALDRKTEGLQPSTHILDLTITKKLRPRSLSLPIHGELLGLLDAGRQRSQRSTSNHRSSNEDTSDNRTINSRSFYWVPSSMAAGAAGSEIYDVNNFSFISPASPTRGGSPTSTIFPVSMRLDAIASQQQKKKPSSSPARQFVSYTSATTGETMRTVLLGPAPRGRTTRRRRSRMDDPASSNIVDLDDDDEGKTFYFHHRHQPQARRARSLERKPSIGAGSFSGISSISGVSGFSGFSGSSTGNALGANMNFFLSTSSREPSSTRPRRTSNVSDDATSVSATALGTWTSIPDVPMLPAAATLEKMALGKRRSKLGVAASARASSSPILKNPKIKLKKRASGMPVSSSRHYVDRGTDASPKGPGAFEPVLPLIEDLVVRFDDDGAGTSRYSSVLDLVMQRCRDVDGARIIHHDDIAAFQNGQSKQTGKDEQLAFDQKTMSSALPETPKSSHGHSSSSSSTASSSLRLRSAAAQAASTFSTDDYDPFAPHAYNAGPKLSLPVAVPSEKQSQPLPSAKTPQPLTPAHTPPPQQRLDDELDGDYSGTRFHVLATVKFQTVLALHNALRSALSIYLLPKPTRIIANVVLAIGSQHDVPSDLMSKIISQLDALGGQPAVNITRGGRLDIRYLIANALQTLAAQQARSKGTCADITSLNWLATATSSPMSSSSSNQATYALATLLIAQLDLYLRTYSASMPSSAAARFVLLDYPSELLPVALALQQLMGRDMVQVATVIAAEDPKYRGDDRVHGFRMLPQRTSSAQLRLSSSLVFDTRPEKPLYMSANYLLTSSASDMDIAAFVVAVRKRLLSSVPSAPKVIAAVTTPETAMTTTKAAFQNGMVTLSVSGQPNENMGRYSALSTATTAAGGTGLSDSNSSRNSKIRTPPRANNLMQSPTLPSPLLINNSPSPKRRGSLASEKETKRSAAGNGNTRPPPPSLPLPVPVSVKKPITPSVTAVRPLKSPAPSVKSQQSQRSRTSSLQSFQSQADSWRTTTKTPSYLANATATPLAPAPVVPPSGRLVAKTIQVNGSAAARRAKEHAAGVVNPVLTSTISIPSVRSDNDNLSNWDAGLDVSEDGNYTLDTPLFGNGSANNANLTNGMKGNNNVNFNVSGNSNADRNGTGEYSGGYNDDDYDYGEDDDDFENDPEMRRLMPLFMRDRVALLAAKEAAGVRGVHPPLMRNKSSQLTGPTPLMPGSVSAARAASASAAMQSSAPSQQSITGLSGKASIGSMHSQNSHGSLANKNGNEGKKARKWLGLA